MGSKKTETDNGNLRVIYTDKPPQMIIGNAQTETLSRKANYDKPVEGDCVFAVNDTAKD